MIIKISLFKQEEAKNTMLHKISIKQHRGELTGTQVSNWKLYGIDHQSLRANESHDEISFDCKNYVSHAISNKLLNSFETFSQLINSFYWG